MQKRSVYLVVFLFFSLLLTGCVNVNKSKNTQPDNSSCNDGRIIDFEEPTTEILTAEIDASGGVLQAKDEDNGQWVVVNIPSGAVEQKTKISLNLEKSTYEVKSGIGSPISFTISPDISFDRPARITIVYDKKYSCAMISSLTPFLVKEDNTLSPAQLVGLYKNQNIFTMDTFHGGTYSWIYAE